MKLYGIVGAGGFGREVMPLADMMLRQQTQQDYQLVFVEENKTISTINGYRVLSTEEFFAHPSLKKYFNIAIANHQHRKRIAEIMQAQGVLPFRINSLNHMDLSNNKVGEGAIFCGFTTITSNATIGKFFHANIYSYVAHDCIIGDYVTFAPNVHCNGNVIIEDEVYVGTGVVLREGTVERPIIIGKGAVIGMGAVVTKSVLPHQIVVGNPAAPIKSKESTTSS